MGVGSWLSRHLGRGLVARFVAVELLVALVGGWSAAVLFLAFAYTGAFRLVLYVLVGVIGVLVGLEIPLLMRILRDRYTFKDVVANVLTFDHLGAPRLLVGACAIVLCVLAVGIAGANRITNLVEENLYADDVILATSSKYQRIVLTAWKNDLRLFLNSHLQFSSRDEYRYHEALVHPGLASVPVPRHVLVLGGGDGLAVREALKYPQIESITLVDLDPEMTSLFSTNPILTGLNQKSFLSPKVHIINADAFLWLDN